MTEYNTKKYKVTIVAELVNNENHKAAKLMDAMDGALPGEVSEMTQEKVKDTVDYSGIYKTTFLWATDVVDRYKNSNNVLYKNVATRLDCVKLATSRFNHTITIEED